MRIKLLVPRAGPAMLNIGDEIDRPDHIALALIANGEATPVATKPIERAVKAPSRKEKRG